MPRLEHLLDHPDRDQDVPIVVCSDSMAPLALLRAGPSAQSSPLGIAVWRALARLAQDPRETPLVSPVHYGLAGIQRADAIAVA